MSTHHYDLPAPPHHSLEKGVIQDPALRRLSGELRAARSKIPPLVRSSPITFSQNHPPRVSLPRICLSSHHTEDFNSVSATRSDLQEAPDREEASGDANESADGEEDQQHDQGVDSAGGDRDEGEILLRPAHENRVQPHHHQRGDGGPD